MLTIKEQLALKCEVNGIHLNDTTQGKNYENVISMIREALSIAVEHHNDNDQDLVVVTRM